VEARKTRKKWLTVNLIRCFSNCHNDNSGSIYLEGEVWNKVMSSGIGCKGAGVPTIPIANLCGVKRKESRGRVK
jgi:hypothetical protein